MQGSSYPLGNYISTPVQFKTLYFRDIDETVTNGGAEAGRESRWTHLQHRRSVSEALEQHKKFRRLIDSDNENTRNNSC